MPETMRHVCGEVVHKADDGFHHRFDRDCELPPMTKCPLCGYELEDGWFRPLYKVEPMARQMMESTINGHFGKACSNCWGYAFQVKDVFVTPEFDLEHYEPEPKPEHLYYVLCVDCKEETQGYVTSGYIGYVRGKDYEDYGRSILSLATVIDLPVSQTGIRKEGHSEKENIEALGF